MFRVLDELRQRILEALAHNAVAAARLVDVRSTAMVRSRAGPADAPVTPQS